MAFDLSKAGFGKESVSKLDKIKRIPLNSICTNTQNFYSIKGIDELADSIQMVGLLNPVTVVKDASGRYRLVSGHRRFEAYRKLREDAQFSGDDNSEWNAIPAIVLQDMDELTESLALVTANSTARELTYDEKLQQEKVLRETLLAMKTAGKDVPKNLGQYIADQIGVSRNEVSRMHSVNENLIPEAREKVAAGEMTAQQAYELSRKPKEAQRASSYVQELVAAYQQKAAAEKDLLDRFVEIHGGAMAYTATRLLSGERFESIKLLGERYRNHGGNSGGVSYTSSAKGVSLGSSDARPHSWTAVWDAVAMYAMKRLGKQYVEERSPKCSEAIPSAWETGTPEKNGSCVCVLNFSPTARPIRKIMYWIDGEWCVVNSTASAIHSECTVMGWLPLPEEDPV